MKRLLTCSAAVALLVGGTRLAGANLLLNGNLDLTDPVEIVPGFFLPKPINWMNVGTRSITGPYEDEMSSEPWAGPAPTPVTTDGLLNGPSPDGYGGPDGGVFFKPFSGGELNGLATGHLYQDVPATPGLTYELTGWAGAEANTLMGAELALEFLDAGSLLIAASTLDLVAAGLHTDNGQPFDYKQFTVSGVAPANTAFVRSRVSMLDAMSNPAGGGQAFVVDDFSLTVGAVPESGTALAGLLVLSAVAAARFKSAAR